MNAKFCNNFKYLLYLFFMFFVSFGISQTINHSPFITRYAPYLKEKDPNDIIMRSFEYSMHNNLADSTLINTTILYADSSFFSIYSDEELLYTDIEYSENTKKRIYNSVSIDDYKQSGSIYLYQYDMQNNLTSEFHITPKIGIISKSASYYNVYDQQNRLISQVEIEKDPIIREIILYEYDTLGYSMIKSIPTKGLVYYYSDKKLIKIDESISDSTKTYINTYDSLGRIIVETAEEEPVFFNKYKQKRYIYENNLLSCITYISDFDQNIIKTKYFYYEYNSDGLMVKKTQKTFSEKEIINTEITYYYY